ncbi:hypothetical protein N8I84_37660 [Streptomyces cynarae]|uniref:MacB-like periplasmic core domain-containing protein n=1 Tax=Streptomyces cynarae TaxID=2981134 RepID=A0ABY6EDA7_9ACTN|nr:hypothetical protein [Streptomyces cynarae]UXY23786.1 hypothetical protein N8I84_37660 [Streptomyces cynarae]
MTGGGREAHLRVGAVEGDQADDVQFSVAGRASMALNLSGAYGPYFTRNAVVVEDSQGRTGLGEVPGAERITRSLREAEPLVVGARVGDYKRVLGAITINVIGMETWTPTGSGGRDWSV